MHMWRHCNVWVVMYCCDVAWSHNKQVLYLKKSVNEQIGLFIGEPLKRL